MHRLDSWVSSRLCSFPAVPYAIVICTFLRSTVNDNYDSLLQHGSQDKRKASGTPSRTSLGRQGTLPVNLPLVLRGSGQTAKLLSHPSRHGFHEMPIYSCLLGG